MNKKIIIYAALSFIILLLVLSTFGIINLNSKNSAASSSYSNLPEKCRPPAGQDIEAWKEHLSHHAETKDCLNYFG